MYYTIQHFIEKDIMEIEKLVGEILEGKKDADDLSEGILNRVAYNFVSVTWME